MKKLITILLLCSCSASKPVYVPPVHMDTLSGDSVDWGKVKGIIMTGNVLFIPDSAINQDTAIIFK